MPSRLKKPVTRLTDATVRDAGACRNIIVTIYPQGIVGVRLARTRREEVISLETVYMMAVRLRVLREKGQR